MVSVCMCVCVVCGSSGVCFNMFPSKLIYIKWKRINVQCPLVGSIVEANCIFISHDHIQINRFAIYEYEFWAALENKYACCVLIESLENLKQAYTDLIYQPNPMTENIIGFQYRQFENVAVLCLHICKVAVCHFSCALCLVPSAEYGEQEKKKPLTYALITFIFYMYLVLYIGTVQCTLYSVSAACSWVATSNGYCDGECVWYTMCLTHQKLHIISNKYLKIEELLFVCFM